MFITYKSTLLLLLFTQSYLVIFLQMYQTLSYNKCNMFLNQSIRWGVAMTQRVLKGVAFLSSIIHRFCIWQLDEEAEFLRGFYHLCSLKKNTLKYILFF